MDSGGQVLPEADRSSRGGRSVKVRDRPVGVSTAMVRLWGVRWNGVVAVGGGGSGYPFGLARATIGPDFRGWKCRSPNRSQRLGSKAATQARYTSS